MKLIKDFIEDNEENSNKSFFVYNKKGKNKLIENFHKVAHFVSIGIISIFLLYLLLSLISFFFKGETLIIPEYLISLVSTIIGFYLGKNFTFDNYGKK